MNDYKGIELKSSRRLGQAVKRIVCSKKITLFTNTPDWNRGKFTAADIIKTFGSSRGRFEEAAMRSFTKLDWQKICECVESSVVALGGKILHAERSLGLRGGDL